MPLQITRSTAVALRSRPLRTIEKFNLAWLTVKCLVPAWALWAAFLWLTHKPEPRGAHGLHHFTFADRLAESAFCAVLAAILLYLVFYGVQQHLVHVSSLGTDAYGSARIATDKDAENAGLLKERGIFLGFLNNPRGKRNKLPPLIRYPHDAHLITVAPPGAGKFRDLLATAIMMYPHSLI